MENPLENPFQIFKSPEFGIIRTAGTPENPLFCLTDICRALELDSSQVIKRLGDGVVSIHPIVDKLGRTQKANFVNEDGLYDVIFDSRKPEARRFRKWITSEVLPALRKYGNYSLPKKETQVALQNPNSLPQLDELIETIYRAAKSIEVKFKLTPNMAMLKSITIIERIYDIDLLELKKLVPATEQRIGYYSPTQLGEIIAKEKNIDRFSSHKVNQKLTELGFQIKVGKVYVLTATGKEYGKAFPYENNGHGGYQVKWKLEVMEFFK